MPSKMDLALLSMATYEQRPIVLVPRLRPGANGRKNASNLTTYLGNQPSSFGANIPQQLRATSPSTANFGASSAVLPRLQCSSDPTGNYPDRDTEVIVWTRVARWQNNFGFSADHYTNMYGENVLAFCGTNDLWDKIANDVPIALGLAPPQSIQAMTIAQEVSASTRQTTWLTGHSLGGALAILAAGPTGLRAVTFNAPGVGLACLQLAPYSVSIRNFFSAIWRCIHNPKIKNFGVDGDFIFSVYPQTSGRETSLPRWTCSSFDVLCRHKMLTVLSQLRCDHENFEPMNL